MKLTASLLLVLAAGLAATSCAQAQDETDDPADAPEPVAKKAPAKVGKRAQPQTFQVKADAAPGGNGSAAKPFADIQSAVDAAQGGDTVVVGVGTYQGGITIGTAFPKDAPLTIRAAAGAQPVISGMKAVKGWKAGKDGVYTTEVAGRAKNLFVGAERLTMAAWPKIDDSWIGVKTADPATKTVGFSHVAPPQLTKDSKIYGFAKGRKNFEFRSYKDLKMDGDNGTLSFDDGNFDKIKTGGYSRFVFFNSPSFITDGDEYAMEYPDGDKTKFSFKPRNAAELATTQYRAGSNGIYLEPGAANIVIAGFAITGMNGQGIGARKADGLTVEDCVLYNNITGLNTHQCKNVTVRRCLIAQNYWGAGFNDIDNLTMEQCEVAFNDEDGIRVSGRVWDKNSKKLGATDLKFSQVYVHHHQYQGHPDNIQFFRGVGRVEFDRCLLMYGGQQMMMEQTEEMKLTNSVVLIGINRALNLFSYDNPKANGWEVKNNTIGYSRYNPVAMNGFNNSSIANLYFQFDQPALLPSRGLKADYDWFAPTYQKKRGYRVERPKGDTGEVKVQENSKEGAPQLRNVPASMTTSGGGSSASPTKLSFAGEAKTDFAVGDLIEVNGDGVARKVETVEGNAITFSPALPSAPFRYSNVLNWKKNTDFQIDIRPKADSPILKAGPNGGAVGADLDVAAYQKGDFNGDGKRDLPPIPQELAAMLGERPNRYIYPYSF